MAGWRKAAIPEGVIVEYRELGRTGLRASRLGFGTVRLPMISAGEAQYVDFERATQLLHGAFEAGINFVDSGLGYGNNQAELAIGRALRAWPGRDGIYVCTKAPHTYCKKPGDLRRLLEHQLQRLERDVMDFYLLHGIGWDMFHEIDAASAWLFDLMKAKEEGLARHIGFSFHDDPKSMIRLVDMGWAELVVCQYNYLDRRNEEAMAHAAEKGVAVVVMGPVGGGRLAGSPRVVGGAPSVGDSETAGLALRFVASNPHVDVLLSGMSSVEMIRQNAAALALGPLDAADAARVEVMRERAGGFANMYCTGCAYCMPCPNHVNIPKCFELYNMAKVYDWPEWGEREYGRLVEDGRQASQCIACGVCVDRCPQKLDIPSLLEQVVELFEKG
jgi:uncharacterized protein